VPRRASGAGAAGIGRRSREPARRGRGAASPAPTPTGARAAGRRRSDWPPPPARAAAGRRRAPTGRPVGRGSPRRTSAASGCAAVPATSSAAAVSARRRPGASGSAGHTPTATRPAPGSPRRPRAPAPSDTTVPAPASHASRTVPAGTTARTACRRAHQCPSTEQVAARVTATYPAGSPRGCRSASTRRRSLEGVRHWAGPRNGCREDPTGAGPPVDVRRSSTGHRARVLDPRVAGVGRRRELPDGHPGDRDDVPLQALGRVPVSSCTASVLTATSPGPARARAPRRRAGSRGRPAARAARPAR
jgi:hypothetical protein